MEERRNSQARPAAEERESNPRGDAPAGDDDDDATAATAAVAVVAALMSAAAVVTAVVDGWPLQAEEAMRKALARARQVVEPRDRRRLSSVGRGWPCVSIWVLRVRG